MYNSETRQPLRWPKMRWNIPTSSEHRFHAIQPVAPFLVLFANSCAFFLPPSAGALVAWSKPDLLMIVSLWGFSSFLRLWREAVIGLSAHSSRKWGSAQLPLAAPRDDAPFSSGGRSVRRPLRLGLVLARLVAVAVRLAFVSRFPFRYPAFAAPSSDKRSVPARLYCGRMHR